MVRNPLAGAVSNPALGRAEMYPTSYLGDVMGGGKVDVLNVNCESEGGRAVPNINGICTAPAAAFWSACCARYIVRTSVQYFRLSRLEWLVDDGCSADYLQPCVLDFAYRPLRLGGVSYIACSYPFTPPTPRIIGCCNYSS